MQITLWYKRVDMKWKFLLDTHNVLGHRSLLRKLNDIYECSYIYHASVETKKIMSLLF